MPAKYDDPDAIEAQDAPDEPLPPFSDRRGGWILIGGFALLLILLASVEAVRHLLA